MSNVSTLIEQRRARRHVARGWPSSAAGFIATSTLGVSPGVEMSWSEMCTWNDDTPAIVPAGRPDLGREVGQRRQVVAEHRRQLREAVADELHPVARVAGEPDHDPVERLRPTGRARLYGHR